MLFELWKSCQNNCTFCVNKFMSETTKSVKANINTYINYLDNLTNPIDVGLVGGELFDSSAELLSVKEDFIKLLDKLCDLYSKNKLINLYFFTNLIYDPDFLIRVLEYIQNKGIPAQNILLSTSFDYKGRFLRENSLQLWKNNLSIIKEKFDKIVINCEMILSEYICKEVLENRLNLGDFQKEYNISLTLIQPYLGFKFKTKEELDELYGGDFFLKRKTFIAFCKYIMETKQLDIHDIFAQSNESDQTFVVEKDNEIATLKDKIYENSCMGREQRYFGYIDSDKNIFEDIKRIADGNW